MIAKVCPAMAMPPTRAAPLLALTAKLTLPPPEPVAPEVIVIQPSLLVAVHAHPVGAPTVTAPVAVPAATFWLGGVNVTVQLAPIWLTRAATPLRLMSPCRAVPLALGATWNWT